MNDQTATVTGSSKKQSSGGSQRMMSQQSGVQPFDTKRAVIYFVVAYVVVTVLASATTVVYGMVYHMPKTEELGVSLLKDPSFVATVPYHVLVMLLVWPVFAWMYFRKRQQRNPEKEAAETLRLSFFWLAGAIIVDWVFFVLIRHPWSLTAREFYVEYQPWISLIYVSIFLSPFIRLGLSRLFTKRGLPPWRAEAQ